MEGTACAVFFIQRAWLGNCVQPRLLNDLSVLPPNGWIARHTRANCVRIAPKMRSSKQWLASVAVCLTIGGQTFGQTREVAAPSDHASNVSRLLKDLRWHDLASHEQYLKIRNERTNRLLSELDGFIAENVSPRATAASVTTGLDLLLGHKNGDLLRSAAFLLNLPGGHFLVIGVEVTRGGEAISEDAFSFRAYKDNGGSFVFASAIEFRQPDVSGRNELDAWPTSAFLQIKALPTRMVGSEFWFLAWAEVSSFVPPVVMMQLFAFDGDHFRTVWAPKDFLTETDTAVELTFDGFTMRKLFDPTGQAAGSPTVVIHEQYALTVDGPQKIGEWEEQRR